MKRQSHLLSRFDAKRKEYFEKQKCNSARYSMTFAHNITCSIRSDSKENVPFHIHTQIHKHTECCKKKGRKVCRFNFPRYPIDRTRILQSINLDADIKKEYGDLDVDNHAKIQQKIKSWNVFA